MNKYHAARTEVDGIVFASKAEAARYCELKLLQGAGEITGLELQPKFPLIVNGKKVATYIADFRYTERGEVVVEDVKSVATRKIAVYRLKIKLVQAIYGIEICEVC